MEMNPWEKLKPPQPMREVEDIAFKRASREANKIPYKGKVETARKREKTRVSVLARTVLTHINRAIKILDAYFEADPFYRDLINLYFDEKEIRRIHKRFLGIVKAIEEIRDEYINKILSEEDPDEMKKWRRVGQGKISTFLHRAAEDMDYVIRLYKYARRLPSIDPDKPTFIVAGPPNTGKSTLVNTLSTAKTKTASYPFTTKDIHVGHIEVGPVRGQIIDTPGLLDREMSDRNEIELKAIAALRNLVGDILYIYDISRDAYYPIERQYNILREIMEAFPDKKIIPIANKMDIPHEEYLKRANELHGDSLIKISLATGQGVDRLKKLVEERILRHYRDILSR